MNNIIRTLPTLLRWFRAAGSDFAAVTLCCQAPSIAVAAVSIAALLLAQQKKSDNAHVLPFFLSLLLPRAEGTSFPLDRREQGTAAAGCA